MAQLFVGYTALTDKNSILQGLPSLDKQSSTIQKLIVFNRQGLSSWDYPASADKGAALPQQTRETLSKLELHYSGAIKPQHKGSTMWWLPSLRGLGLHY